MKIIHRFQQKFPLYSASALAVTLLLGGALQVHAQSSGDRASQQSAAVQTLQNKAATPQAVVHSYSDLVYANYADTLTAAIQMQQAIEQFLATPNPSSLDAARKAWIDAREYYGQTEVFRFYSGPIDGQRGPEGQLNAWPMDESHVDYVKGKPDAGIINNLKIDINRANLIRYNERGGEENVATGWHAIEFLLWGQDFSKTGPGNRSYLDYVHLDGQTQTDKKHLPQIQAKRRAQYLREVVALLVDDLTQLKAQWAPNVGSNYRASFEADLPQAMRNILTGMASLASSELASERMQVALYSKDQEDEHSCFSDNTHRDVVSNVEGIRNVWTGQYQKLDGTVINGVGVQALLEAVSPDLSKQTTQAIEDSLRLAENIQAPFDQEILGGSDGKGRQRIQAAIKQLQNSSALMVQAAAVLQIPRLAIVKP